MEKLLQLKKEFRLTKGLLRKMLDTNRESRRLAFRYLVDVVESAQPDEVYKRALQTLVELEQVREFLEEELKSNGW